MAYSGYNDYFDKKVIITVATTGGLHGKEANPNLPEQPDEVIEDIINCREAGASMVHLHARDEDGERTKDVSRFQELQDRIQEQCPDIIVNFTTGGRQASRDEISERRIRPILETDPRPEMATIDLGPLNFGAKRTSVNFREQNREYARRMRDVGVKPELEVFNPGHLDGFYDLFENGHLQKPYWCSLILGMQSGTLPTPRNLINLVDNIPEETNWQCIAIGRHQLPLTTVAIAMGGHIRVGLEDNVFYRKGERAESNAQLVSRAARIAGEMERPIATPNEARKIIGL